MEDFLGEALGFTVDEYGHLTSVDKTYSRTATRAEVSMFQLLMTPQGDWDRHPHLSVASLRADEHLTGT